MDKSDSQSNHLYQLDELMSQTRKLAAQYRLQTGQILPISNELAKYDAQRLLDLSSPSTQSKIKSVDCIDPRTQLAFQVKARVIFKVNAPQRVGQLNLSGDWDQTLLVIYDEFYEPDEIYALEKGSISQTAPNKRGGISVGKFKLLGKLVWSAESGIVEPLY